MPSDTTSRLIGEKTFGDKDQKLFARVSRDYNPIHMDAVAARRLIAGRQVVHGIHVFLTALEFWDHEGEPFPASLDCNFNNPVSIGDPVCFMQREGQPGSSVIEAVVNGLVCTQITIAPLDERLQPERSSDASLARTGALPMVLATLERPLEEDPSFHVNKAYRIELNDSDLATLFPKSCCFLGKKGAAGIASLSYFIGMVCPGLRSVFSSFSCCLPPATTDLPHLEFFVRKYDSRFRLVDIAFQGAIQGSIRAFLRPSPQQQPTVEELTKLVQPGEFAGTRSLVVGGSRGLGELTAKILAAGGGKVVITYASGVEDARRIQDEITASGKGECVIARLDFAADDFDITGLACAELDMVFFYATPRIFRKKAEHFEEDLFSEFCLFYIKRFYDFCSQFEHLLQGGKVLIYLPSTVAITDRPRGIAEYAMAKAAAEILAEEINRNFQNVSIVSTRLPRLNTDQTATILAVATESNVSVLLPLTRSMHATIKQAS